MKHGNEQTKAYIAKNGLPADFTPIVEGDRAIDIDREMVAAKRARKEVSRDVLQKRKERQLERKSQRAVRAAERREAALDADLQMLLLQKQLAKQESVA